MEYRFRCALARRYCRLLARCGSPHAQQFTEVPADIFSLYQIVDWRNGVAQTQTGEFLYSLHVASPRPDIASDPIWEQLSKLDKAAAVVRYLYKHPSYYIGGTITKQLRADLTTKVFPHQKNWIDYKTAQVAVELASKLRKMNPAASILRRYGIE
jgi:hypothetical protein